MAPTHSICAPEHQFTAQFLSPDVLLRIFEFAVAFEAQIPHFRDGPGQQYSEEAAVQGMGGLRSASFAPHNVSQVCRNWRTVALDFSLLWSTLSVRSVDIYRKGFSLDDLASTVKARLQKSGNTPLTLSMAFGYFGFKRHYNLEPLDAFNTFINTVFSERRRWKKVSFFSFLAPVNPTRIDLPVFDNLSLLEELSMRIPLPCCGRRHSETPTMINLSSCTELRKLELDGDFELVSDGTTLEKLTHIEILKHDRSRFSRWGAFSAFHVAPLIQLAPVLVTLILDIYPSEPHLRTLQDLAGGDIRLAHLTELHIRTSDKEQEVLPEVGALLNRLVLPALEDLNLEVARELDVASLIKRSGCSIRVVSLDGTRCALESEVLDPMIVTWLSHMPELRELWMDAIDLSCGLNRHLTLTRRIANVGEVFDGSVSEYQSDDGHSVVGLCRSLKTITLLQCEIASRNEVGDFVAMLGSRMREVKGSAGEVEAFRTGDCDIFDIVNDETILKWIDEGVSLHFT
ncbi:hypothetical protein SCHPADRAFT_943370 [Schizopora paradoxa]|uniref:Uncharacterized protein n=1 Tax=Schizopora paradoxa TaxID=27342 RepID=A0A0H2RD19_9AGAM|nr:hypothetical protein SCHPADRAFT_943370 [Schizopora paradoxa]